jgi:hypothetical protein
MRCWKIANGNLLLEEPYDNIRMSKGDPLPHAQESLLLKTVNARMRGTGLRKEIAAFRSYYEVDEVGRMKQFYEASGSSQEGELYSCSYLVMDSQLWKFWIFEKADCDPKLNREVIYSGLTPAPPPLRIGGV